MPIEPSNQTLPAEAITVRRGERQRREIVIDEHFKESIRRRGLLHPVIVRREGDEIILIAGERRRQACLELNIPIPVRFFEELSPAEADIVELEENLKRVDLEWKDQVRAVGRIHQLYLDQNPAWQRTQTADAIGMDNTTITGLLTVFEHLHEERILSQPGWRSAYNMISRANSRLADAAISTLMDDASEAFQPLVEPEAALVPAVLEAPVIRLPAMPIQKPPAIIHESFLSWAPTYVGPRFNLIHCDFPYGIGVFRPGGHIGLGGTAQAEYGDTQEIYVQLLDCLLSNLDRILSHSAHLVFWFSMDFYEYTRVRLSEHLIVFPKPLFWLKSDNAGVAPDPKRSPRQIYETAFLCYRGDRSIVRVVSNGYYGPTDKSIHPSAKPEPMLKHFFSMLVDGTTRLLDPTAGGGSSIRAAESFGAEHTFGMDINQEHVQNANDAIRTARILRQASKELVP